METEEECEEMSVIVPPAQRTEQPAEGTGREKQEESCRELTQFRTDCNLA